MLINKRFKKNFFDMEIFLYLLYKVLFENIFYPNYMTFYGYILGKADININKKIYSWIAWLILVFVCRLIRKIYWKILVTFVMYVSVIPSLSVYYIRNESTVAFLLICIYWLVFFLLCLFFSMYDSLEKESVLNIKINDIAVRIISIFVVVVVLYFAYIYSNFRFWIDFSDVYTYRLNKENMINNSILKYVFSWIYMVFLPILLLINIYKRRVFGIIVNIISFFLMYSIYGNKYALFLMIIDIVLYFFRGSVRVNYVGKGVAYGLIIFIIVSVFMQKNGSITLFSILGRLLCIVDGHYFYYDFFSTREKLYLRQSFLRHFLKDPYDGTPVSVIIGSSYKYNHTGSYNNFNNGAFSDAYANFGWVGVFIQPIIVVCIFFISLKILKKLKHENNIYILYFIFYFAGNFLSVPIFQILLSEGLVMYLVLIHVFFKYDSNYNIHLCKKSKKLERRNSL